MGVHRGPKEGLGLGPFRMPQAGALSPSSSLNGTPQTMAWTAQLALSQSWAQRWQEVGLVWLALLVGPLMPWAALLGQFLVTS